MFNGCSGLATLNISGWDTSNVTDMAFMLYNSVKKVDMSGDGWVPASIKRGTYSGCYRWIEGGVRPTLGKNWFGTICEDERYAYFSGLTSWTDSSVRTSLVTNSYDRKANGLPDLTIILNSATKKVLTVDDIAAMTAKGYIIA